jgi:hypothetical protein
MEKQIIDEKANLIFQLLGNTNREMSFEASFKITHKKLLQNRFILAVEMEKNM